MKTIRSQFPCFRATNCVYLDSAATTQVPDAVFAGISDALAQRGNPHRSVHSVAERSHALLDAARQTVAGFIHAEPDEIAFTGNTTDAVNVAVDSILQSFAPSQTILVSIAEHHSNLLPYLKATAKGARIEFIGLKDGLIDIDDLRRRLSSRTRLIAIAHSSNVLGNINDITEIGRIVKSYSSDILYLVDGTQAVAHLPVDVKAAKADFYVFSSHKMYGPDGVGVLYVNRAIRHLLSPVRTGGGTVKDIAITFGKDFNIVSPEFDASLSILGGGTPNTSNIIGLAKAVDFLHSIGWTAIRQHETKLTQRLLDGLRQMPGVEIYGPSDVSRKIGVVSFGLKRHDISKTASHLAARNICIRYGAHCALPLADSLGQETLRVSLGIYNTEADVDVLLAELGSFLESHRPHVNHRCDFLNNLPILRHTHLPTGEEEVFELIDSFARPYSSTEVAVLGGHFLGIPCFLENRFYPSIAGILPTHLEKFAEEFGMTSFPLYTFELAAEAVRRLKLRGAKAKVLIVANDTTGINELRHSPANRELKSAELYRDELLAAFEQTYGLPRTYEAILEAKGLSPADIVPYQDKLYFRETILRRRFKDFVSRNKEYFEGIITYVAGSRSVDVDISILANPGLKNCTFDSFDSKTGGKFCVVTVAELMAELFGTAAGVTFHYLNGKVLQPKLNSANRSLVMLTPAMCDPAVNSGAELYMKLFLQGKVSEGYRFLNLPLGPRAKDTISHGVEATEIALR